MGQDETVTIHEPGGKKMVVPKNQFDKPWYAYRDEPHIKGDLPDELYQVEFEESENFPNSPLLVTRVYKDAIDASVTESVASGSLTRTWWRKNSSSDHAS